MKLREAAMNIKTNWREIIIKLLDLYPEIENVYKMDYIHLHNLVQTFQNLLHSKMILSQQMVFYKPVYLFFVFLISSSIGFIV